MGWGVVGSGGGVKAYFHLKVRHARPSRHIRISYYDLLIKINNFCSSYIEKVKRQTRYDFFRVPNKKNKFEHE